MSTPSSAAAVYRTVAGTFRHAEPSPKACTVLSRMDTGLPLTDNSEIALLPVNMTKTKLQAPRTSLLTACSATAASLPLDRSATNRSTSCAVSQITPRPTSKLGFSAFAERQESRTNSETCKKRMSILHSSQPTRQEETRNAHEGFRLAPRLRDREEGLLGDIAQ